MLYDLPRAPLPDPETPAPARLVPRFDNLVLSHADRSRVLGDLPPSRIVTKNGIVHATILVDGFVAGTWQLEKGRVVLEPFGKLGAGRSERCEDGGRAARGVRGLKRKGAPGQSAPFRGVTLSPGRLPGVPAVEVAFPDLTGQTRRP